ncbi:hypothetical protein D3C73_1483760 [compost metagenome]
MKIPDLYDSVPVTMIQCLPGGLPKTPSSWTASKRICTLMSVIIRLCLEILVVKHVSEDPFMI